MANPDLSIITLTYNSEGTVKALLDSIKKSPDKLNKEVIVIDNHSQDDSVIVAKNHPLKPKIIQMPINAGFSKAVNRGIESATGKYIFLLNPDTKIMGNCLALLYSYAQNHPHLGALAPRLFFPDGKPQASVFHFPNIVNAIRQYFLNIPNSFTKYLPENKTQPVDVAVMAALFIPRSVLSQVGYLDERFFMYYEDIEFCRRLKKANLPVIYLPVAKVMHLHGASGKFKSHLDSPLLASARTYHGVTYSNILNLVLFLGQKWQKLLKKIR